MAGVMLMTPWGGNHFTPLLVHYRTVGGMADVTVDLLLGVYVLGIIPALVLGGPLSNRYGRRPLLLPAAPLSALGSLLLALGPDRLGAMVAGRLLAGVGLGLAMGVGTTWLVETCLFEGEDRVTGARRAGITLTLGLLAGAAVAAAGAEWRPDRVPAVYVLHAALSVAAGLLLLRSPETRVPRPGTRSPSGLSVWPTLRRYPRILLPAAPWVFACASAAYAVIPARLAGEVGDHPVAFAGLATVVTLSAGTAVQMAGKRLLRAPERSLVTALAVTAAGMTLGALAVDRSSLPAALGAVLVLGTAYGMLLGGSLVTLGRSVPADDLAATTALLYSFAYVGFFLPALMAALADRLSYSQMLLGAAGVAVLCLLVLATAGRRARTASATSGSPVEQRPSHGGRGARPASR